MLVRADLLLRPEAPEPKTMEVLEVAPAPQGGVEFFPSIFEVVAYHAWLSQAKKT